MKNYMITQKETDVVQDKKLDSYGWKHEDFLASQELTVTITLGEYRELVSSKATSEQSIKASNDKTAKAEAAMKEAKAEAERLKAENYDLQNKIMALSDLLYGSDTGRTGAATETGTKKGDTK